MYSVTGGFSSDRIMDEIFYGILSKHILVPQQLLSSSVIHTMYLYPFRQH
jgi:hypothetical protein